ncbi:hypothetical protein [Streptomyces nigra]|uniref:hypothetical protein n=1 Tax=Streptomyces nigra TaxID=1827580 RepID=UPI0034463AFE
MSGKSARAPKATTPPRRARARTALTALLLAVLGATALTGCGGDDDGDGSASARPTPTPPDTASFSGSPAPGLSSLEASARERASAAASSASARASAFEASVSAELQRANDAAQERLKDVDGRGNATADVALTGKPRADTGDLLAVVVAITNRTDETASYAVQVDFRDPDGKVVETRFVGAEDLEPGERAEPVAISRKPPEPRLTAEIAKAQRY